MPRAAHPAKSRFIALDCDDHLSRTRCSTK
jgi:hypothetical protein